jgi:hypothetical protein
MLLPKFSVRAAAILVALLARPIAHAADLPQWSRSTQFDETSFTTTVDPKIRINVNAPVDDNDQPVHATRLIVFALPNGNTLEQTLGCEMKPGMDWHYDIQHIAAQTRLLRTLEPRERIVLVCAEAPGLSWPSFRKNVPDANAKIGKLVEEWRAQFGEPDCKVTLTGHSGGGSFDFGVIESAPEIPAYIDRIAFLDSNYAFDATLHAEKLAKWLNGNKDRRLVVICYNDREITLDGKKVVSPTGGTWRATGRMHDALGKCFELTDSIHEPFQATTGLDGRIHFYKHPNPQNKILHTALVGEMNGLLHIATLGTPLEEKWGKFGGPRAYTKFVQSDLTPIEKTSSPTKYAQQPPPKNSQSNFPVRPADAIGGAEFVKKVAPLPLKQREAAILHEITSGNFPNFLRTFKTIEISGIFNSSNGKREVTATMEVMSDYLAVGSDADFVRMPMTPQTAQQIANRFDCVLPTRKMVNAIDEHAELKLAPHPMTEAREAVATFAEHNQIIEKQRGDNPLGLLTIGIKKDIVLTPRIFEKPQRLAIYGWRQPSGQPIQPLTIVHWDQYVDYSHGVRLVRDTLDLNGKKVRIDELLTDPNRCGLVGDEGPMQPPRYPTE